LRICGVVLGLINTGITLIRFGSGSADGLSEPEFFDRNGTELIGQGRHWRGFPDRSVNAVKGLIVGCSYWT
jgi:hypothetical protein